MNEINIRDGSPINPDNLALWWFRWVLFNALSGGIGATIGGAAAVATAWISFLAFGSITKSIGDSPNLISALSGITWIFSWMIGMFFWGFAVGVAQSKVIFGAFFAKWSWVFASSVGCLVGIAASWIVFDTFGLLFGPVEILGRERWAVVAAILGIIIGAVVGIGQWTILSKFRPSAFLWIIISIIASGISFSIAWSIIENSNWIVGGLAGGLVEGLLTGAVLIRILRARPA